MCSNCQFVHSFQVLLWVSHRGALLWPAVLGSSWNGRQGGFQNLYCLFFSFVSIFAQFHTLATLVGESNVSRTTSKPEAHCSHYQQVTLFTAIKEGSSAVSCKYQKLQIKLVGPLLMLILTAAFLGWPKNKHTMLKHCEFSFGFLFEILNRNEFH